MRRLAFDRLHHAARGPVRRGTQQQVDILRPDGPLQNLDVTPPTVLLKLLAKLQAEVALQDRLAILRAHDEMTVHRMNRMGQPTVVAHGRLSCRKPPESEGVPHPRVRP